MMVGDDGEASCTCLLENAEIEMFNNLKSHIQSELNRKSSKKH